MSKRKQRKCRICKKRPPWRYKNCPPGICKRCYHRHVWAERPRRNREAGVLEPEPFEPELFELEPFEPEPWWDPDGLPF
jgi:hypothetical protein